MPEQRSPSSNPGRIHVSCKRDPEIAVAETGTVNPSMQIAESNVEITVRDTSPLVRTNTAGLASTLDSRAVEVLPLPTRNVLLANACAWRYSATHQ